MHRLIRQVMSLFFHLTTMLIVHQVADMDRRSVQRVSLITRVWHGFYSSGVLVTTLQLPTATERHPCTCPLVVTIFVL
jgi:hypothetical protein